MPCAPYWYRRGAVVVRLPAFTEGVPNGCAQQYTGATPYTRYGNVPVLILAALLALAVLIFALRRARPSVLRGSDAPPQAPPALTAIGLEAAWILTLEAFPSRVLVLTLRENREVGDERELRRARGLDQRRVERRQRQLATAGHQIKPACETAGEKNSICRPSGPATSFFASSGVLFIRVRAPALRASLVLGSPSPPLPRVTRAR